jgi:hypothetical protein
MRTAEQGKKSTFSDKIAFKAIVQLTGKTK